jgi:hypothetical protein
MKRPNPASTKSSIQPTLPIQSLGANSLRNVRGGNRVGWGDGNGTNLVDGGITASDDWETPVS